MIKDNIMTNIKDNVKTEEETDTDDLSALNMSSSSEESYPLVFK